MKRAISLAVTSIALAACGGPDRDDSRVAKRTSQRVSIETYLATPQPNDVTLDRAQKRCLTRGTTAVYMTTRKLQNGTYQHIYECYEGLPVR